MFKTTLSALITALFFSGIVHAQSYDHQIQYALNSLKKTKEDTSRVQLYLKISSLYFNKNGQYELAHDSTVYYSQQAETLSNKLQYNEGLMLAFQNMIETQAHNRVALLKCSALKYLRSILV